MEACLESKEPTSAETESAAVHEEFPKEETAVRTVRALTIPAPRKGHCFQGPGRGSVARGAPKGQTLKSRQWMCQEGSSGIRDQNLKAQLHKRAFNKTFRQTVELEIAKQIVETSNRLGKMVVRILWRGRPPLKEKKRPLATD
jgi:hypothetical protein